ncbi:GHKL domain-containing protein [Bacillus sp. EB600]|nr:GHKL domain-containing protein [Bacillus sp. EB600]
MLKQDDSIVIQAKERCKEYGIDPTIVPTFTQCLSSEAYAKKITTYSEILNVVKFFIKKFLSSVEGTPILVAVTDEKGHILKFEGDSTILHAVKQLGIKEGVRYVEKDAGVNAVSLALQYDQPIQLVGEDHYCQVYYDAACYSVPFRNKGNTKPLGTISLLTYIPHDNPLLLVMLHTIVDSIERELLVQEKNKKLFILNQGLLQTSYQAVIVTDAKGDIIDCNENGKQILKLMCPKRSDYESSSILYAEKIGSYFKDVLSDKQEIIGIEISIAIDDALQYFILDVIPIFDDRNSLIYIVGSLRDISEMKSTEAYLRNTEKLSVVGQMAAGVAHEIRNPLTTIKGLLQFSKDQFKPDHYKLLMSEIDRMNFIVSELLVLGKPHVVHYSKVELISIMDDILKIFESQAVMNGISITRDINRFGTIYCDPNQIKQVFINILKNAMEAIPFGGNIHVTVDIEGSEQLIRFIDNGEGIPEDVLNKIGQPFCTTKKDGNGLGIMVTKKIIESHNGKIQFNSQVKSGTTVEIRLPLLNL